MRDMTLLRTFLLLPIALLTVLSLSSCKTARHFEQNRAAGDAWLAQYTSRATTNVGGVWVASDWGLAKLEQDGRKVTGMIDSFQVEGVVSGNTAYLLISENNWIYYTAVLQKTAPSRLSGHFSYSVPFQERDQRTMMLRKL